MVLRKRFSGARGRGTHGGALGTHQRGRRRRFPEEDRRSEDPDDAPPAHGSQPLSFKAIALPVLATNNVPRVSDASEGFSRRLMVIAFARRFEEAEIKKWGRARHDAASAAKCRRSDRTASRWSRSQVILRMSALWNLS